MIYYYCLWQTKNHFCSPFFKLSQKEHITNCFSRVDYVPFTRGWLKSKYTCHELGEDAGYTTLQDWVEEYEQAKVNLTNEGLNVEGIFDADIPIATKL